MTPCTPLDALSGFENKMCLVGFGTYDANRLNQLLVDCTENFQTIVSNKYKIGDHRAIDDLQSSCVVSVKILNHAIKRAITPPCINHTMTVKLLREFHKLIGDSLSVCERDYQHSTFNHALIKTLEHFKVINDNNSFSLRFNQKTESEITEERQAALAFLMENPSEVLEGARHYGENMYLPRDDYHLNPSIKVYEELLNIAERIADLEQSPMIEDQISQQ